MEVHIQGMWGTVCDDLWDLAEATVLCRQLQCGQVMAAPTGAHFGAGSGKILLDDVQCAGTESHLGQCEHRAEAGHNCGHLEDSGVVCTGKGLFFNMTSLLFLPLQTVLNDYFNNSYVINGTIDLSMWISSGHQVLMIHQAPLQPQSLKLPPLHTHCQVSPFFAQFFCFEDYPP